MERILFSLLPVIGGQAPPGADGKPQNPFGSMLFLIVMMVGIMYFLLIRPQSKYRKQRQAMIEGLRKHDQIITRGGLIGTITDVRSERDEIVVEIAKNTRVRMRRAAVEAVLPREGSEAKGDRNKSR